MFKGIRAMTKHNKTHTSPLGQVPLEWPLKRMDSVANISYGISDSLDRSLKYGIKLITMPDVTKNGKLAINKQCYILEERVKKQHILKKGDLLFNWRNGSKDHLGKTAFFDFDGEYTHVGFLLKIRSINIAAKYLYYYLNQLRERGFFLAAKFQVNNTFNKQELSDIPVVLPKEDEQKKIASLLDKWDRAINLTESIVAEKLELRKGLIQQLLRGNCRFPSFVSKSGYKNTRYGKIPIDWEYVEIGEVARHVSEKNGVGKALPVLSCTKHQGLVDSLAYFGKQVFSKNLETYKIVKRGQFAYATNHIEEGSIGYQDIYDKALISPMYTVFETGKRVDDRFLFLIVKTELYRHIFESMTSSSVNRRGSLRWKDFSKILIPLPLPEEQAVIVKAFETVDCELNLLEKKSDLYRKQKKGLMQQLLTGKIRVKGPEAIAN